MKFLFNTLIFFIIITLTISLAAYDDTIDFSKDYPLKTKSISKKRITKKQTIEFKKALKNISWAKKGNIVHIQIIDNGWTLQRDEFTGIARYKYIKAEILIKIKNHVNIFVIPCTFIKPAKFFGLSYGEAYYRMCHKYQIYQIKPTNINQQTEVNM